MTTLNNAIRLLQAQIRESQPALLTSFGAAPYHPGAPTLPAPVVPALLVHGGLNKNDLHDPTVPVAVQVVLQSDMFENDDLTLYLGTTAVAAETLRQEHLDSGIVTFYLAPSVFPQEGPVTLHYHHFVPMSSAYSVSHDVGPFLVKQTVPGDPDPDPLTPYLNERLTPITGIPDPVPPGQPLTVTVPRYAHISEGDTLVVYFSSEEVSTPVTAEQASNPNLPLTVTIPASVIDRTPGIGLIVRYDIHDTVKNWSLYSMEARVDVVPPGALHAPTVRDANDYDELDMDDLDGADVAIQIPVNGNLPLGTDGVLTWTGLPVIGPRLTHTQSFKIERAATRITLYVPNAKAAALVDSTATVYYEATLNGVNTPSQRASVQVIGEPVTLEKPTLTGVSGDSYNPASIIGSHQEVIVPAYGFMDRGQAVILHWEGRTASGSPLYVQERKELTSNIPQDVSFLIDKVFATVLGTNTTLKAYYEIIVDGVTYASPKLELTIVGVPSNLPKPTTEPVFANGEIDPDTVTDAIKVVVEPNSTLAPGDLLTVKWLGRSGASIILNEQVFPSSGNLEIRIGKSPYIDGNTDAYVDVSYEARRNGQPVGSSQVLQLHVGEAAEQPWPLPTLIDATNGQVSTWQPVKPGTQFDTNTATVVISDPRIRAGDAVAAIWRLPNGDEPIPWATATTGEGRLNVPYDVLARSLGKPVQVVCVVFRGADQAVVGTSPLATWQIALPPASVLPIPYVEPVNEDDELDLSEFSGDASAIIRPWLFIQPGQKVWMRVEGEAYDGSPLAIPVLSAYSVESITNPFNDQAILRRAVLRFAKAGKALSIVVKVSFDGTSLEENAMTFPVSTLKVSKKWYDDFENAPLGFSILDRPGFTVDGWTSGNVIYPVEVLSLPKGPSYPLMSGKAVKFNPTTGLRFFIRVSFKFPVTRVEISYAVSPAITTVTPAVGDFLDVRGPSYVDITPRSMDDSVWTTRSTSWGGGAPFKMLTIGHDVAAQGDRYIMIDEVVYWPADEASVAVGGTNLTSAVSSIQHSSTNEEDPFS